MESRTLRTSINLLDPDPVYQVESKEKLIDLALKIGNTGLVLPIAVRENDGRYSILSGNLRYMAAKLAGLTEVEIFLIPDSVEDAFNLASECDHDKGLTDMEQYVTMGLLKICGPESRKRSAPFLKCSVF